MKTARVIFCAVLLLASVIGAAKDGESVSEKMRTGNFVFITTSYGDGEGENLSPTDDDRRAAAALDNALHEWLRYKTVKHAHEADIILVARTSKRRGSPSVSIGNDPRRLPGTGLPPISGPFPGSSPPVPKTTTNNDSGDDYLLVFDANRLDNAPPIWERHMRHGFGPDMALFQQFKRDVESAKP
jgi:hypothetical protein